MFERIHGPSSPEKPHDRRTRHGHHGAPAPRLSGREAERGGWEWRGGVIGRGGSIGTRRAGSDSEIGRRLGNGVTGFHSPWHGTAAVPLLRRPIGEST